MKKLPEFDLRLVLKLSTLLAGLSVSAGSVAGWSPCSDNISINQQNSRARLDSEAHQQILVAQAGGGSRPSGVGGTRPEGVGGSRPSGAGGTRPEGVGGSRPEGVGGTRPEGVGEARPSWGR